MSRVRGVAIGLCLLLAACQGKSDQGAVSEADAAKTPGAPALAPAVGLGPKPDGADSIDTALAAIQGWNARAPEVLKTIAASEAKIDAAATRALEAARGAEAATPARRTALSALVNTARKEADAARATLIDGAARLRKDTDERVTEAETAMEMCGTEGLLDYEACKTLEAEYALLVQNIDALNARYQQAEAAYGPDRAKLEEASASVALSALR